MKPDCYTCAHRREVPGSCHSSCVHPDVGALPEYASIAGALGKRSGLLMIPCAGIHKLGITAEMHGITHGWFIWPVNFDPVWLTHCDGFTPIETVRETVQS